MNSSDREAYRQKLQEIAGEYEARGYEVVVEPGPEKLPEFLAGFHPDLVARGPNESVVIEVKNAFENSPRSFNINQDGGSPSWLLIHDQTKWPHRPSSCLIGKKLLIGLEERMNCSGQVRQTPRSY
jgi:REase_AHJR-like